MSHESKKDFSLDLFPGIYAPVHSECDDGHLPCSKYVNDAYSSNAKCINSTYLSQMATLHYIFQFHFFFSDLKYQITEITYNFILSFI